MDYLRVATIGAWGHLGAPIGEMNEMNDVKLVAMAKAHAEETPEFIRENACALDDAPVFDDHREMLMEIKPDVAIVSCRLDLINPCAVDAANAGCHLIVEKPMATTHAELKKLCDAARANNVKCISTMSGNNGHPCLQAARQIIDAGTLGKIVMVNARKSYRWNDDRAVRFTKKLGGIIGWVGIHALNFISAATGQTFTSAAGMESHQLNPEAFSECPDNCGLVFSLSGGGHATVSMDYHRPKAAVTSGDDWIRIVGTEGDLEAHLAKREFQLTTHEKTNHDIQLPEPTPIHQHFLRALMGKEDMSLADKLTEQVFMLMNACLYAQDAVNQGRAVRVEQDPYISAEHP